MVTIRATESRWRLPGAAPGEAKALAETLAISLPAARVLLARGYHDAAMARRFLYPSIEDLNDPFLMCGMRAALDRLRRAIAGSEKILLYGDYDVDGTASVVIVKKAIELAGGHAGFYIPHRIREQAASDGVRLIVSLDTGIRATAAVARATELGIDVIVTDHHLPDAELPRACAVLNPKQPACEYPDKDLCGAGVAFKLVQALLGSLGWPVDKVRRMTESFLKVVAIATVADVVPLTGENRVIVKYGLEGLRSVRNPGLRALLDVAGCAAGEAVTANNVAFRIAPRMNAAGLMADANEIVNLLLTDDEEQARAIAARLQDLNRERQDVQSEIVRVILEECLAAPVRDDQAALVFAGKEWHRGVVGIVAGRLADRFHRPVFVLAEDSEQGVMQGSGRSTPAFHLLEALESMQDLLIRFGGHRQAAGLTLASERVEEFRQRLTVYAAARLTPADFVAEIEVDAPLGLEEIDDRVVADILAMEPFGCGNPAPVFAAFGVEVAGPPAPLGERHLLVRLGQNDRTLRFKAWGFAGRAAEFAPGARLDAAFSIESDDYAAARGYPGWCAVLKDVRGPHDEPR